MNPTIKSALLAITLTLGCGGISMAQAPKPPQVQSVDPWTAIHAAEDQMDYATEVRLLRTLVEKGDAVAQLQLGTMYEVGQGVAEDYKEAVRLFRLAAAQGNSEAQHCLGWMYHNGKGVVQNYKEAVRLYGLAAVKGNLGAMDDLAVMYELGEGVAQDYVRAHMWYNLSASSVSGELAKQFSSNRDSIAVKMTPAQIAEAQAMALKCQASNFKKCD